MKPLLICLILLLGCDQGFGTRETVVDLSHIGQTDDGAWQSSPWEGPLIAIEPESRVFIFHGLGRRPNQVLAYVGFAADDTVLMPATGNAAEIHWVDETAIVVRNGSGGNFYYRFVLR